MEELAGYLKMQVYCRVPVAEIGFSQSNQNEVGRHKQRGRAVLQKFVAGWWRKR